MLDYAYARKLMVERQLRRRGVSDRGVIHAMLEVPREAFVETGFEEFAYEDCALPIAEGQTISQPYIVGFMAEAAEIRKTARVLEVGGGSGYSAAVLSRMASEVFVVERCKGLVERASARWKQLGYDNIQIMHGDGTKGWLEHSPFDAILVAAGGKFAPPSLKAQLKIDGVMIIPVGGVGAQELQRIRRVAEDEYEEEVLSGVSFVPLIGEEGWKEDSRRAASRHTAFVKRRTPAEVVADASEPLPDLDDPAFADAFGRYGQSTVVLLGEATHGTAEFYRARAAITRCLIERHGFTIVAAEADWPDAARVDRHVRWRPHQEGPPAFRRFPSWMWRNLEFAALVDWMRTWNAEMPGKDRAGFYGLDIYSLSASIEAVLAYLDAHDPSAAAAARQRYACLTPWQHEPSVYGRAVLSDTYRSCEADVLHQCEDLLRRRLDDARKDKEALFDAAQNARLIASAERYYRIMYYGGAESWNLRDTHMFETLARILEERGPTAKAVVWAHNSHIGDARHTDMGVVRDELNVGQLCRDKFGDQAALIGFGTDRGEVAAADDWDGDMKVMRLKPARTDSFEAIFREAGRPAALLDFRKPDAKAASSLLSEPRLERFVGVIYRPENELQSHYASAVLSRQFDAYAWFDKTHAVTPLKGAVHPAGGQPDTWPFGL